MIRLSIELIPVQINGLSIAILISPTNLGPKEASPEHSLASKTVEYYFQISMFASSLWIISVENNFAIRRGGDEPRLSDPNGAGEGIRGIASPEAKVYVSWLGHCGKICQDAV